MEQNIPDRMQIKILMNVEYSVVVPWFVLPSTSTVCVGIEDEAVELVLVSVLLFTLDVLGFDLLKSIGHSKQR
jgi:hypothetical protein